MRNRTASTTVFSVKDAVRLRHQGVKDFIATDPKLLPGQWYHRNNPDKINEISIGKTCFGGAR